VIGEQLREVDRVPGVHAAGEEPEHRQHQQHLPVIPRQVARGGNDPQGAEVHKQKRPASPEALGQRPEAEQPEPHPGRLHDAVRELGSLCGVGRAHSVPHQQLACQVLPGDDDAPERAQPHGRKEQPKDRPPGPAGRAQQFAETSQPPPLAPRPLPALRLAHAPANRENQQCRHDADQVRVSPVGGGEQPDRGRHPRTQDARRVEDSTRPSAGTRGKDLRDQRGRYRPLATHSQRDQEPQQRHLPELRCEAGQCREDRVQKDGGTHGRLAAEPIRQHSKPNAPDRPAQQEHGQEQIAPELLEMDVAPAQQIAEHVLPRQVENLSFQRVEHPSRRRDCQHEPLIAVDIGVPGRR